MSREEDRLQVNLERLDTISEKVDGRVKRQRWHIQHTDRLKRETDELAKRLGK